MPRTCNNCRKVTDLSDHILHFNGDCLKILPFALCDNCFSIKTKLDIRRSLEYNIYNWSKHQRIDRPNCRYPLPQSDVKIITNRLQTHEVLTNNSTIPRRLVDDSSTNSQRALDDYSPPEGKGREGKGKDKDICEVGTSPVGISAGINNDKTPPSNNVQEVFTYWQTAAGHPRAKLDKKRHSKLESAFKMGYSV